MSRAQVTDRATGQARNYIRSLIKRISSDGDRPCPPSPPPWLSTSKRSPGAFFVGIPLLGSFGH